MLFNAFKIKRKSVNKGGVTTKWKWYKLTDKQFRFNAVISVFMSITVILLFTAINSRLLISEPLITLIILIIFVIVIFYQLGPAITVKYLKQ